MPKRYYEKDADLSSLKGRTVAIVGYGSQGHAHSLNLRDSGVNVVVAELPASPNWEKAKAAGLNVMSAADAAKAADVIMILVEDHHQKGVYDNEIGPQLKAGKTLMFAHGFNIHFGQIGSAERRRCVDDRAQGPRPPCARTLRRGRRSARPGWPFIRTPPATPSRTLSLTPAPSVA